MRTLLVGLLLNIGLSAIAAPPDTVWTRTYHRGFEECHHITETADHGFALVGNSQLSGNNYLDILLVRTDAIGNTLWTRTYGDTIVGQEGRCVVEDGEGNLVVVGTKHLSMLERNAWIIKTNSSGDTLWTRLYGGATSADAHFVDTTSDGGYIITGRRYDAGEFANAFLLKLDGSGDVDWTRTVGGLAYEEGNQVQQTDDGGYMVAGVKDQVGDTFDFYLIKTDADGVVEWTQAYGGSAVDYCRSGKQTADQGYILFGESDSYVANSSWVVKADAAGDTLWTRILQRSNGDYGYSVNLTEDGGFIFGGYSNNPGYRDDYWFTRLDADGNTVWMKTVGHGDDQRGMSVLQASDGGYVLAGSSSEPGPTFQDFYVVKLGAEVAVAHDDVPLPHSALRLRSAPNPFNPLTVISYTLPRDAPVHLAVYDLRGQKVATLQQGFQPAGNYRTRWHGKGMASGIHIARLDVADQTESMKIVLLK